MFLLQNWYPGGRLRLQVAAPKHDWRLLVVLLAVELKKGDKHIGELCEDGVVLKERVLKRCSSVVHPDLRALLDDVIKAAEWEPYVASTTV